MVPPADGSRGLRGTEMVAHWYPDGPASRLHFCHATATAGVSAEVVDVAPAAVLLDDDDDDGDEDAGADRCGVDAQDAINTRDTASAAARPVRPTNIAAGSLPPGRLLYGAGVPEPAAEQ